MPKRLLSLAFLFLLFCSHDMYLKMPSYFLKPHEASTLQLFNGTFQRSDNIITRDRMLDVSLVGNGLRTQIDSSQWTDEGNTSILKFTSGDPGTWVAGVSTRSRNIEMSADKFNSYLKHDGVLDELEWRKENNMLSRDAIEKYSKHVKAIFQVGNQKSDDWKTVLGYPIEFVPLKNPYELRAGDTLKVKLLMDGNPLTGQLVYAAYESNHSHAGDVSNDHTHDHDDEPHQHDAQAYRTDTTGVFDVPLEDNGHWYLRTIHMAHSQEEGLTHESNWATLTFEINSEQDKSTDHRNATKKRHEETRIDNTSKSLWKYLAGAAIAIGLIIILRRKQNQN